MNRRSVRAAIGHGDAAEEILWRRLGVLHRDIEIALRQPLFTQGIEEFILAGVLAAALVRAQQVRVGKRRLRILVDHRCVGMGGQIVGVEPVVLDVLAVVALLVGQTVGALFENLVASIPQCDPHADDLIAVAPAGQTVFIPPVGTAAGMFERKVRPRITIGAVVLADRAPRPLTQVGSPAPPVRCAGLDLIEAVLFGGAHDELTPGTEARARANPDVRQSFSPHPADPMSPAHTSEPAVAHPVVVGRSATFPRRRLPG